MSRAFYELYADRNAFDAHERQPHVETFLAERERYVKSHRSDLDSLVEPERLLAYNAGRDAAEYVVDTDSLPLSPVSGGTFLVGTTA
ncbi:hypothetical protein [Amycolatopsis sp. cmx-11-12]|uniref:hypothetical protein n=1 Tax=Amycolatopsis sp. cmx-11-12 TaxID=2785795 RepID=UPI0039185A9C